MTRLCRVNDETARAHRGFDRDGRSSHDTQDSAGTSAFEKSLDTVHPALVLLKSSLRAPRFHIYHNWCSPHPCDQVKTSFIIAIAFRSLCLFHARVLEMRKLVWEVHRRAHPPTFMWNAWQNSGQVILFASVQEMKKVGVLQACASFEWYMEFDGTDFLSVYEKHDFLLV